MSAPTVGECQGAGSPRVAIIGGGIAGLSAALALVQAEIQVSLFEASDYLGGQIRTCVLSSAQSHAVIEEGAEGWVARSEVLPDICRQVSVPFVAQNSLADCEVGRSPVDGSIVLTSLEAGEAARKLGFQVPAGDRGKGIYTATGGMSEMVRGIQKLVENSGHCQLHLNANVFTVFCSPESTTDQDARQWGVGCLSGETREFSYFDQVIFAVSPEITGRLLEVEFPLERVWNSHVSVHVLVEAPAAPALLRSVTIESSLQEEWKNLRAISVCNDKFPGRVVGTEVLVRFYFRGLDVLDVGENDKMTATYCVERLKEIFGLDASFAQQPAPSFRVSVWDKTLPEFPANFNDTVIQWKDKVNTKFGVNSLNLHFACGAFYGAGLHVACVSGIAAGQAAILRSNQVPWRQ